MFVEILPNVFAPIVVEFTVRLGYAIFTVADADVPRLRHPAAVARLGAGHLDQLRRGDGGLLVGGAVRRARDRVAGDRRQAGRRSRSRECSSDEHRDGTDGQLRRSSGECRRARRRAHRRHLSRARAPARRRARRLVQDRSWRVLRAGGRIRLRQVDDRARRRALPGAQRLGQRRLDLDRRPGRAGDARRGAAQAARQHGVDGLSGARPGAEPVDPGRTPGRRGVRDRRARDRRRRSIALARCSRRCGSPTRPA